MIKSLVIGKWDARHILAAPLVDRHIIMCACSEPLVISRTRKVAGGMSFSGFLGDEVTRCPVVRVVFGSHWDERLEEWFLDGVE